MAYSKTNWQDLPSTTTPLNATNLNKIENELSDLDSNKVNKNGDTMTGPLVTEGNLSTGGKNSANDGKTGTYIGKGNIELSMGSPFIDFHFNNSTSDYSSRIIEDSEGTLHIPQNLKVSGDLTGPSMSNKIDFSYLTDFTNGIARKRRVLGADFNSLTTFQSGLIAMIGATANAPVNRSSNSNWFVLQIYTNEGGNDYITQIATFFFDTSDTNIYIRKCSNGTWGAWRKIATSAV